MTAEAVAADERTPLLSQDGEVASPNNVESGAGVDADDAPNKPKLSLVAVMTPLVLGIFLVAMDTTIVTSTYASIGSQFEQLQNTSWIATAYMMSLTSFQPLYGKLSDIFGRKVCLLFAYTIFALGCLFCGLARNMTELVAARALAGVGGGGISTVGSIIMSDVASLRQRGTLQGIANIAFAAGQASGAPLGGFLADASSSGWRLAFLVQVPLMVLAALSVGFGLALPRPPTGDFRAKLARVDFAGAGALVCAVFLLLLGLDRGGNVAWADRTTVGALGGALAATLLFLAIETEWAREPFAPKRIVAHKALFASYLCNLFSSGAAITLVFHVSLYLQAVQGVNARGVGLAMMPMVFGGVAGSLTTGLIMQATGRYYKLTLAAFTIMSLGSITASLVTGPVKYSLAGLMVGIVANNFGYGSGLTSTLIALVANAGKEDQAIATATSYLFRSLGSVVGLSVGTTLTQDFLRRSLHKRLQGQNVEGIIRQVRESLDYLNQLEPVMRAKVVASYQDGLQAAFWFTAILSVLTVFCAVYVTEKPLTAR